MRILALFLLLTYAATADSPFHDVLSLEIPEGEVARVQVDGQTVWPSIPYVTNGLIAYWDGVWNAGRGVHDASARAWKDLAGANNWALYGLAFDSQSLVFGSQQIEYNQSWAIGDIAKSIAVCGYSEAVSYFAFSLGNASGKMFAILPTNNRGFQFLDNAPAMFQPFANKKWSVACNYSDGPQATIARVFYNGEPKTANAGTSDWGKPDEQVAIIGYRQYPFKGQLFCIRIYNRRLSDAEIAHNAAIDALRFGIAP